MSWDAVDALQARKEKRSKAASYLIYILDLHYSYK